MTADCIGRAGSNISAILTWAKIIPLASLAAVLQDFGDSADARASPSVNGRLPPKAEAAG
ncbi:hypothetical protein [Biostraticola tofi]|uniref:Uncharacterized protein n=1 Tax=Biostraticola tofi TaxID=466109 RepID=A0A4R3Z241_9GAMM|nr:hypothetical protein [Biostraticola tofi]TCV98318.1 hypothetical protein EDC52_103410 [Biostraticola tofi]